jgi:hypothetical protein
VVERGAESAAGESEADGRHVGRHRACRGHGLIYPPPPRDSDC